MMKRLTHLVTAATVAAAALSGPALAQEANIRATLAKRLPDLPPIDQVSKSPIPGLYEVRVGSEVIYTDKRGDHVVQGTITETRGRTNLTQARIDKFTAIDFATLPLTDAIVWKQGSGARKLVVFADPNCGYCRQLESDLLKVKDVTVYTFLYPILGGDSPDRSRDIWCAKDNGAVWRDWMIHGTVPPRNAGACDTTALERNLALGKRHRVRGTPSLVFENGKRVPGALPPDRVENELSVSRSAG